MRRYIVTIFLIAIGQPAHTTHDTENVVVGGIDTDLGSLGAFNCGVRQDQLKCGVINSGEVASATWLMFLWANAKRIQVDEVVRDSGVRLVRLNPREVGPFALREAVLAVKLELGNNNRVLSPAVHVQGCLREHESSGIRDTRVFKMWCGIWVRKVSKDRSWKTGSVQRNLRSTQVGFVVRV